MRHDKRKERKDEKKDEQKNGKTVEEIEIGSSSEDEEENDAQVGEAKRRRD